MGAGQGEPSRLECGREQLVLDHLPLVGRIVARLRRRHGLQAPLEDLEAYARAGLVEAARRFDPARGIDFAVFAQYRVTGALWDGIREMGWQVRRRGEARFAELANAYLEEVAGERPHGVERVAGALEERTGSLAVIFVAAQHGTRPDELPEELPDEAEPGALRKLERAQLTLGLQRTLQQLPQRERRLFEALYHEGRQLQDIAAELGCSKGWASRLHRRTIEKLRSRLWEGGLIS
ncbi:MAG: sigma-70 family RNA polymerase sigma factor [Deltaproteobacteria bacterium]|nr:sigma-70 family RNA polymerase sigma factor [Deltaproteobacteria bacterium]